MENEITDKKVYKLSFNGNGGTFFGIVVVNWLLTALTLSLYYPWAKARQLQYMYSSTTLNDDSFTFHGTGKEMFKGYIKALVLFGLIYGLFIFFLAYLKMPLVGLAILYIGFIAVIPLAIHGSYRYRFSRTSWRGIRFGYRGNKTELFLNFLKWMFLTIITLGIYGSWMEMNLRRYLINNLRAGDIRFNYKGKGDQYFVINFVGGLLLILTLGIYSFWYYKKLFNFYIDNLSIHKEDKEIKFVSTATAGDFFNLGVVNLLIIVFTLGLGYAWVVTRTMNLVMSRIKLIGDIDLDTVQQTEVDYNDATGEDMTDFLNIDLVF